MMVGVLFGVINIIFLYPLILKDEEFGLTRILLTISVLASNIAAFGTPSIIIKYFPYFNTDRRSRIKLLLFSGNIAIISLIIVLSLLFVFEDEVAYYYNENANLFGKYYVLLYGLIVSTVANLIFSSYCKSLYKSVFQNVLNEIGLRLWQTVLLIIYYFDFISFTTFMHLFVFGYFMLSLLLLLFILRSTKRGSFDEVVINQNLNKEMTLYGGMNFLSGLAGTLTGRIDTLMIASMIGCVVCAGNDGLAAVGIYSWALYISTMIDIPARSISNVAGTLISEAWKDSDLNKLNKIYRSSSLTQLIIGILIFLCIWINLDVLFLIKPDYASAKWIVFFLALGKLTDVAAGLNGTIINTSKYYYFITIIMILLVVLTFVTNLIFIPMYGAVGAAVASAISIIIYNLFSFIFLIIKFKMQPFTFKTIIVLFIGSLSYLLVYFITFDQGIILDSVVKTVILVIVYIGLIVYTAVSNEINDSALRVMKRLRIILGTK